MNRSTPRLLVALGLLVLAVATSTLVRIRVALADPNFDAHEPRRMLWSDPALLYYFTERIVENGGTAPEELRHDPHVEWPNAIDVLAFETVAQEYVAAAWHRLATHWWPDQSLHVSCVQAMALAASLTALGVFGLAWELCGGPLWGALAAVFFALLPANYRTLGFILIREDFSLPWLALHFWLLARAARVRTGASFALAGLALLGALATWHAMGFVVALEAAVLFAWFLRTGRNPFSVRRAWIVPAVVAAGSCLVPVLRAKIAALSLPMQIAAGLLAAAAFARPSGKVRSRVATIGVACGTIAAAWIVARLLSDQLGGGIGDYSHVFRLMLAKVVHLGQLPANPRELDFEARLLWQGPFETGSVRGLALELTVGFVALLLLALREAPVWWRGRTRAGATQASPPTPYAPLAAAFGILALIVSWLVVRTTVVAGMVAPVAIVALLVPWRGRLLRGTTIGLLLAIAGGCFGLFVANHRIDWYAFPDVKQGRLLWISNPRQQELPRLLSAISRLVPAEAPIAADLVTSTAILAHTRHPILLQPKYETRESRRRIEEFLTTLYDGTPDDFAAMLRRYECRHVVIDIRTLGAGSWYLVGLPEEAATRPRPGSAAALLLARPDPPEIPGFKLLYRSAPELRFGMYRLFEVVPRGG